MGIFRKKTQLYEGLMVVVACIVILILVLSVQSDKRNVSKQLENTLNYLKSQCLSYDEVVQADKIKSLIRLTEKAVELGIDIQKDESLINERYLKQFSENQRISGVIILDKNLHSECEYSAVSLGYDYWENVIKDSVLSDIMEYPKKIHTERIIKDGDYYDLAVTARSDSEGLIFCYCYQNSNRLTDSYAAVNNLLAGYAMNMNGTLFITSGEKIYGTNNEYYEEKEISDIDVIKQLRQEEESDKLVFFQSDGHNYFGGKGRYRNYNLYVYYPENAVFATSRRAVLFAACILVLIWTIIIVIKNKSARIHVEELNEKLAIIEQQQKKEAEYKEKLKQAMEEAVRANAAKTDFLRRMSHDIRTPINGIRGMIEISRYYKDDLNKQGECREKIWEASGFLLDLVNDVLDMNKLESGEIQLSWEHFELQSVLDEVSSILSVQANNSNITFYPIKTNVQHGNLIGSPLHLRQILLNVAGNAIKYNISGGEVEVSVSETMISSDFDKVMLEFTCRDTGIGMSEEFQKRMFEPFAQEKEMLNTTYKGTGLGLPIVKKIVDKMQGTIEYKTKRGEGTKFTITLPFIIDKSVVLHEEVKEQLHTSEVRGMKVLIVEDNMLNMEIAEFICENEGMSVTTAYNGKEALDIFAQSKNCSFDVILLDLMMPVMGGLETAQKIRSLEREDAKIVPIIAMTANAFSDDVRECKNVGMNEHVSKPLDSEKLLEIIAKYKK